MSTQLSDPIDYPPLLRIRDLVVEYSARGTRKPAFRAVDGISLDVRPGETLGWSASQGRARRPSAVPCSAWRPYLKGQSTSMGVTFPRSRDASGDLSRKTYR